MGDNSSARARAADTALQRDRGLYCCVPTKGFKSFIFRMAKAEGLSASYLMYLLLLDGLRVRYGLFDMDEQQDLEGTNTE